MDKELVSTLFYGDIEVPVVALKEGSFKLGVLEIKLKPGSRAEVPYRILPELLEKKIVEVDADSLMKLQHLQKIRWMESKSKELSSLEEGFYLKTMIFFRYLKARIVEGEDYEYALRKAKVLFEDIVRIRLSKISQLAVADPTPSRELMERMTREERVFYTKLCGLLGEWERGLKEFVEGDDKWLQP